jgi:PhnB protein
MNDTNAGSVDVLDRKATKAASKAHKRALKAEKKAWKKAHPKKEPWVSPTLLVNDIRSSAEYYERAFGFKIELIIDGPDGKAMHASLRHRRGSIMLSNGGPWKTMASPSTLGGSTCAFYVYVADVDALVTRAVAAGCTVVTPPTDEFWGDRCARVLDPEGHGWMFATHRQAPLVDAESEEACSEDCEAK